MSVLTTILSPDPEELAAIDYITICMFCIHTVLSIKTVFLFLNDILIKGNGLLATSYSNGKETSEVFFMQKRHSVS